MINFIKKVWKGEIENQISLIAKFVLIELLLAVLCIICASLEIKYKDLIYSPEEHQRIYARDFSFTLPIQLIFILFLFRNSKKLKYTDKRKLIISSVWSYSKAIAGVFIIISFYLANSYN